MEYTIKQQGNQWVLVAAVGGTTRMEVYETLAELIQDLVVKYNLMAMVMGTPTISLASVSQHQRVAGGEIRESNVGGVAAARPDAISGFLTKG